MSRRDGSVNSLYPLAADSRSRRRLVLRQAGLSSTAVLHAGAEEPQAEPDRHAVLPLSPFEPPAGSGESPSLRAVQRLLQGSQPVTWVFTGDSITHGAQHTRGSRSFVEHFAERVRWELRRLMDVVINTGVNGARCEGLRKHVEWRCLRFQPDVVSLTIGLAECIEGPPGRAAFGKRLADLIDALRRDGAVVLVNTPNRFPLRPGDPHADLPAYVDVLRHIAAEAQIPLVDHWSHWEQAASQTQQSADWLAEDGLHPGPRGHRELARLLFSVLGIFDAYSPACAVDVPT